MQDETELAQDAEVPRDICADDREQGVNTLPIHGIEVYGVMQQTQRDERGRHMQQDRVSHVRDRDPVPDAGGAHGLSRFERRRQELPVDLGRQRQALDNLPQHAGLIPTSHIMMDAADGQQFG